jgi:hypothetical protein
MMQNMQDMEQRLLLLERGSSGERVRYSDQQRLRLRQSGEDHTKAHGGGVADAPPTYKA